MRRVKSLSPTRGRTSKPQEVKVKRVPLTKSDVANYVAMQAREEYVEHPIKEMFGDILHEMVEKMVYSVCNKYSNARRSRTVDDLAQNCWLKIMRYIPRFEKSKSSFSTYCYRICSSACNDAYRLYRRTPILFTPTLEDEEADIPESRQPELLDIKLAVSKAIKKFRHYRKITIALFGDPRKSNYQCPSGIDLPYAAEVSGHARQTVQMFYIRKLGPFLRAELKERKVKNVFKRNSTRKLLSAV